MITGISSACFYPLETEKSIERCGELGFRNVEIFVNAQSEMSGAVFDKITSAVRYYGMDVCSVHPFTSFSESFVLFGSYTRRVYDGIEYYKNFFEFAQKLGAKYLILHGGNTEHTVDGEEYFERYARLYETGKSFGITLTHENVVRHRAQSPDFVKKMSDYLGDSFKMTLDIKQCRRAGELPESFIDVLGNKIVNVHVSDFNPLSDCIAPFEGNYDFSSLISKLNEVGYKGKYLIELYSGSFTNDEQLKAAAEKLDKIINNNIKQNM